MPESDLSGKVYPVAMLGRRMDFMSHEKPRTNTEIREHLANERTLLAWVRTGVGLISVGFVVERAGALASAVAPEGGAGGSEFFGLALVALGCISLVVGAVQFFRARRMIQAGYFDSSVAPYLIIVAGSLALAISFIVYALVT